MLVGHSMNPIASKLSSSPALSRVLPFAIFLALTAAQGLFGEGGRYWIYAVKTLVGAIILWQVWPHVAEMRWRVSGAAIGIGVVIFALWVGLDPLVPNQQKLWVQLGLSKASEVPVVLWNPFAQFGEASLLGWFFVIVRIAGTTLVVPPLEEAFYRSFLYRWIASPDFQSQPLGQFAWKPFLITALIFGFAHNEWLAGILCAAAYQGLVCWRKNLGEAMTAHAVTNLLLGIYVVSRSQWQFW
jgi:CAAX prenyl protease-like protein